MIRKLFLKDIHTIHEVINQATQAYQGVIPDDCCHELYMPKEELRYEMKNIAFFGWEEEGKLVGVIGFQPVKDVTLTRHAYVLLDY